MTQTDHEKANEYKQLCEAADGLAKKKYGAKEPEGWTKCDSVYDKSSNFKSVIYQKGDEYVVCFVGTDRWSAKDHGANLKMALGEETEQMKQANAITKQFLLDNNIDPSKVTVIGHSEGGTEATYVGVKNGIKTVTFNAYGISKRIIDLKENYDTLITNYRDSHDPVSKMKENVGKTYIVDSTQNKFMSATPFGSMKAHGIKTLGDCTKSVPCEDYKKQHPMFLNKISDAEITREDIGKMDSELFSLYEKEIDNRMSGNQIFSNSEMAQRTSSGGTIYVQSYTRDDGTEVSGYYRRPVTA